ncbi:hypothetical protein RHS01_02721 [Rhizoctonia solani]|uniref:Uncharacterized protein n=1 Tax=Rhizoctonia solani TaxID=456999 RepID=A0A8H7IHD7_9AGAM|nr:hypothetical protein RHS01_02721 [Rhizoctonia solani]
MDRARYYPKPGVSAPPPGFGLSELKPSTLSSPFTQPTHPGSSMTQTLLPLSRTHDSEFSRASNKAQLILLVVSHHPETAMSGTIPVRTVDEEETEPPVAHGKRHRGNWGNKMQANARWMKLGKCSSWGPSHAEWESSEPPSPRLPQRRSPTPPSAAPYASPISIHSSFSSFVLDPSIQHSFHSTTINELERTASELIEGESALRHRGSHSQTSRSSKRRAQAGTERGDGRRRGVGSCTHASDSSTVYYPHAVPLPPIYESNMLINQETQIETFEKSLAFLRELMDDGTEFTERLEEIREGLGTERAIRKGVWKAVRVRALQEMEGEANDSVDE